jgi:hypothetical protein
MLYLEALWLLKHLTDCDTTECKGVKFGCDITWTAAGDYVLAAQEVPQDVYMLILGNKHDVVQLDPAVDPSTSLQFRRSNTRGRAWWILSNGHTTADTELQQLTSQNLSGGLTLDVPDLILAPPGYFCNLMFNTTQVAPAGVWRFRTKVFAMFIPPKVADIIGPSICFTTDDIIT